MGRLSIATQTMYLDLVERAWRGHLENLSAKGTGSVYKHYVRGRAYWYLQEANAGGRGWRSRYIGPDDARTRERVATLSGWIESRRERREMVRALRSAGLPAPDRLTAEVLGALAEAGTFRLRACVIGSVAFQAYGGLLGVRLPGSLARTGDLDVAQFRSVSVAVADSIDSDFADVLKGVDPRFHAVPDPGDRRHALRYVLRANGEDVYAVDVLAPLQRGNAAAMTDLPALGADAQTLRFLDFLLYQERNAVALYGSGIPINVPAPERFAIHKLVVAGEQRERPRRRKDVNQAEALLGVLLEEEPDAVRDMWHEARGRGRRWRENLNRGVARLSRNMQNRLLESVGAARDPACGDKDGKDDEM